MEKKPYIKRTRYLVAKGFQLKYTFIVVVFMFLIAWLSGYTVYDTAFGLLGEKLANVYPQGRLMAIFRTTNLTLLIRIGLLVPFVVIISIILSHRMAGPVFRMEQYLGEIAQGDFSSILRLRKKDEFKNLADAINRMTQDLGRVILEKQRIVIKLSSILDKLNAELKESTLDRARIGDLTKEAGEQVRDLKDRFAQYRTESIL